MGAWAVTNTGLEPDVVDQIVTRVWDQLVGRLSGPLWFRFVIQPLVAVTLAIRAGARDARSHRPAYLWTLITDARDRRAGLLSGWRDVSRLFAMAAVIDSLYQIAVLGFFYPLQTLAVAGLLAIVPYVATRGLVTRVLTRYRSPIGR